MTRSKKLIISAGALLILAIVTIFTLNYEEQQEIIRNSDEIILQIDTESVSALSFENETTSLEFNKAEEKWLYSEDENFPVSDDKMNELLGLFSEFGAAFIIEQVEDFAQYGLTNPICTINFTAGETDYEVLLGNYSTMDEQRYVSIGDGNVYLVKTDPLDYYNAEINDMIDNDKMPSYDAISSMTIDGQENYSVVFEEESTNTYNADDVYFADIDGEIMPLDTERVNAYLQSLSNLNPTNYISYTASEENLETYGLTSPELTFTLDYTVIDEDENETSETFVLHISRDPDELAEITEPDEPEIDESTSNDETGEQAQDISSNSSSTSATDTQEIESTEETSSDEEAEEITAYARVGESQIIYQLTGDEYNMLMAAMYNDFRHDEVITADFSDITAINIALDDENYSITSSGAEESRIYLFGETELDVTALETSFASLAIDEFTSETPTEKLEIALTLMLDNENFPQVNVEFYQYSGDYCLAVLEGTTIGLVQRTFVVDVVENINAIVLN